MMRIKLVILTMPVNIWRILETTRTNMRSSALNFGPKNYNYQLLPIEERATDEDLRGVR